MINPLRLLERLPPYKRLASLIEESEAERERNRRTREELEQRVTAAEETIRRLQYEVTVLSRSREKVA